MENQTKIKLNQSQINFKYKNKERKLVSRIDSNSKINHSLDRDTPSLLPMVLNPDDLLKDIH